jgi:hypothetical protein
MHVGLASVAAKSVYSAYLLPTDDNASDDDVGKDEPEERKNYVFSGTLIRFPHFPTHFWVYSLL